MKELKAYKVPPVKAGDADAHVQKFSPPKAPKSPEEADIANELKAYEAQTVEIEYKLKEVPLSRKLTGLKRSLRRRLFTTRCAQGGFVGRKACLGVMDETKILRV